MKAMILVALFLMVSPIVKASEIVLFERQTSSSYDMAVDYAVAKASDRIYLEVEIVHSARRNESTHRSEKLKLLLEDFQYDQNSRTIVLNHEGQQVECAKVTKSSIFKWDVIRETGCKLTTRRVVRNKKLFLEAVLKINE